MYTAEIKNKSIDKVNRKILVGILFKDGEVEVTHNFVFPMYTTFDAMKKVVKEYAEELAKGDLLEPTIELGAVDLNAVVTDAPQLNQDFTAWIQKKNKLDRVNELIILNVFTGSEVPIVALIAEVKDEFEIAFLDLM